MLPIWLLAGPQVHSAQAQSKRAGSAKYVCLPPDIPAETVVEAKQISATADRRVKIETAAQRLNKMNARCKAGKLRDHKGREIRFYRLQSCWGNPPADYLAVLDAERKELADLKKKFAVVEITCNPSGLAPF